MFPLDDRRVLLRACAAPAAGAPAACASAVLCGLPTVEHSRATCSMRCAQFSFEFESLHEQATFERVCASVARLFSLHQMRETLERDVGIPVDGLADFAPSRAAAAAAAAPAAAAASTAAAAAALPAAAPGGGQSSAHTAAALAAAAARARAAAILRACAGLPMPLTDHMVLENALPPRTALRPAPAPPAPGGGGGAAAAAAAGAPPALPAFALQPPPRVLQPLDALCDGVRAALPLHAVAAEFCEKYGASVAPFLPAMGLGELAPLLWPPRRDAPSALVAAALGVGGSPASPAPSGDARSPASPAPSPPPPLQAPPRRAAAPALTPTRRKRCGFCDATEACSATRRRAVSLHPLVPCAGGGAPLWTCEGCYGLVLERRAAAVARGTLLGADGTEELCAACGLGPADDVCEKDMLLCSAARCPRAYCRDCVGALLTGAGAAEAEAAEEWLCPPCAELEAPAVAEAAAAAAGGADVAHAPAPLRERVGGAPPAAAASGGGRASGRKRARAGGADAPASAPAAPSPPAFGGKTPRGLAQHEVGGGAAAAGAAARGGGGGGGGGGGEGGAPPPLNAPGRGPRLKLLAALPPTPRLKLRVGGNSKGEGGAGGGVCGGEGGEEGGGLSPPAPAAAPAPTLLPVAPSYDPVLYFASYAKRVRARADNPGGAHLPTEDECFACRDGGQVAECDYKGPGARARCAKVYHPECIAGGVPEEGRWRCPRHACGACGEAAHVLCRYCPAAWCARHAGAAVAAGAVALLPVAAGAWAPGAVPAPLAALLEAEAAKAGAGGGAGTTVSRSGRVAAAARREGEGAALHTALAAAAAGGPLRTPDLAAHATLAICSACEELRDAGVARGVLDVDEAECHVPPPPLGCGGGGGGSGGGAARRRGGGRGARAGAADDALEVSAAVEEGGAAAAPPPPPPPPPPAPYAVWLAASAEGGAPP